jgi:signal transduction histidine kinase
VRIVQEALTNIRKHAQAERVKVTLAALNDRLEITIADDGVGITPGTIPQGHFGLQTMRERAESVGGTLRITSLPGQGTTVLLSLPLDYHEMKVEVETHVTAASARR